jgi:hypothetical protein
MRVRVSSLVLPWVVGLAVGCSNTGNIAAPAAVPNAVEQGSARTQAAPPGSGLILNSLTGITVPLIGQLGDVNIDQAIITNFALVENTVGQVVGLEATGILKLTGGVLGTDVVTEDFTTTAKLTSSGPGQCSLVTIDLGPVAVDALGVATVDVPAASLTGRGSGAVGSLLCNLGQALAGLGGGGAGGLVNAINNQI